MLEIPKVWGKEIWIVNCEEYCGKLLMLNKGAESSYHYHPQKKETFYCLEGEVILTVKGEDSFLLIEPYTIQPNTPHSFYGLTDATILEVSTKHDDNDVVRLRESKSGMVK